jgi:outer membrane protein TolC
MNTHLGYLLAAALGLLAPLAGCVSPGPLDSSDLGRSQQALAQRGPQQRLAQEGLGALQLDPAHPLPDLEVVHDEKTGRKSINLSLDQALTRALVNNLDIRVISFDSAISRQQTIEAAAEFDYTVFGGANYAKEDVRSASTLAASQSKTYAFEAGVKQKFVTGSEWALTWALVRAQDDSGFNTPNPYYEPTLVFQITQPLLRDAWTKVNLADVRIAKLSQQLALAQFRQKVEDVATEVISTYWSLVQARREVEIAESLLDLTQNTLARVRGRQEFDATAVQVSQAEQKVASRRAVLIQTRKTVKDVQDRLARFLADAQINVLGELEIVPSDAPLPDLVSIDTQQRLETALKRNPVLDQARLAIEIADINVDAARHQQLPQLNLTASAALQGLDDSSGDTHDRLFTGNYFGWDAGLVLEYPLGNRLREAQLRRTKFERLKAITSLQNFSDQVAVLVNERIRQVDSTYQQWQVQKVAAVTAGTQLKALEDTEKIRGKLTPEFLLVKLQAQEDLARSEQAEQQAIVDYNIALVELARATGTVLELYPVRKAMPLTVGEDSN